jgi:hypothetical protein
MARRYKTGRIKSNKAYSVDELADVAEVLIPTVRSWLKDGLQRVDSTRPTLVMGFQALEYLNARKANAKRPMKTGEFFCMRCKAARAALGAMADYEPQGATSGQLKALCSVCEAMCNRNIRVCDLPDIRKLLDVEVRAKSNPIGTP